REEQEDERHRVANPPERSGDHSVDDVADHTLDAPPLAGGHNDRQADEPEPDAVAAVVRLEVARRAADAAPRPSGQVGETHPRAPDGPEWEGEAAGAGRSTAGSGLPTGRTPASSTSLTHGRPGLNAPRRRARRRGGRTRSPDVNATRK